MVPGEQCVQPYKRHRQEDDVATGSVDGTPQSKRRAVHKFTSAVSSVCNGSSSNGEVWTRDFDSAKDLAVHAARVDSSIPAPPQRVCKVDSEEVAKEPNNTCADESANTRPSKDNVDSAVAKVQPSVKVVFLSGESIDVLGLKPTDLVRDLRLLLQDLRPGVRYFFARGAQLLRDVDPIGDITHVDAFAQRGVFFENCDSHLDVLETGAIAMDNVSVLGAPIWRPSDDVSVAGVYACAVAQELPPGASAKWEISILDLPNPRRYFLAGVLAERAPLVFTRLVDLLQQAVGFDGYGMWWARLGVCGRQPRGPQLREGDVLSFDLQKGMLTLNVGSLKRQAIGLAGLRLRPFVGFGPGRQHGELRVQIRAQTNHANNAA